MGLLVEELVEGAGAAGVSKVLEEGKARGLGPLEAFCDPACLKGLRTEQARQDARRLASALRRHAPYVHTDPPREVLEELLEGIGFAAFLAREADGSAEALLSRERNVEALLEQVQRWREKNPDAPLGDLLSALSLEAVESAPEGRGVQLMTVHASKGMEFSVVFLFGFNQGVFPLRKAQGDLEALEEERRLFYVAVTRAKEQLFLSCSLKSPKGAQSPSPFLAEVQLEQLDYDPALGFHGRGAVEPVGHSHSLEQPPVK
ncbi:ATP-dependent DNA helicase PcrA [Calidithermus roseus]|uniref:ATP-dependent DNA helicase PcrA n=1 Tax=Calidithermus roseus TaxID=1644118 RepID=A0A399EH07_9DEIN|nr:ATP-dependent DNA helicase PcrA [Calidithermus roseus]